MPSRQSVGVVLPILISVDIIAVVVYRRHAVWTHLLRLFPWSATGVGRTTLPVLLAALAGGGHLRVGMEDTLTFAAGQPVRDNAELVERAAAFARLALRPPMTPDEARAMLGIRDRTGAR